jgi:uncharacterized protein YoxC
MKAEKALLDAYGDWHRLAEAEGKAIRLHDWNFLLECQKVIQRLQPQITELTRAAREEWKQAGADLAAQEKKINAVVSELIAMGECNKSLLQAAREAAKSEREQLEQASQNLKRLQHSYAAGRPTAWSSFS